jgi:ornithine cyclodeaminase
MRAVLPEAELRIWARRPEAAAALAEEVAASVASSVEEALAAAQVVCTTTSAREPILRHEWLEPGAHVNAVGSSVPSARELDAATVAASAFFVDRRESTLNESGDYLRAVEEAGIGPEHIRAELGELLVGAAEGRRSDDELTVFKSLGIAVEDLAAAELCVERALARGIGTEVEF